MGFCFNIHLVTGLSPQARVAHQYIVIPMVKCYVNFAYHAWSTLHVICRPSACSGTLSCWKYSEAEATGFPSSPRQAYDAEQYRFTNGAFKQRTQHRLANPSGTVIVCCLPTGTSNQVWGWLKAKKGQRRVVEELKKRKAVKTFRIGVIAGSIATLKASFQVLQRFVLAGRLFLNARCKYAACAHNIRKS